MCVDVRGEAEMMVRLLQSPAHRAPVLHVYSAGESHGSLLPLRPDEILLRSRSSEFQRPPAELRGVSAAPAKGLLAVTTVTTAFYPSST